MSEKAGWGICFFTPVESVFWLTSAFTFVRIDTRSKPLEKKNTKDTSHNKNTKILQSKCIKSKCSQCYDSVFSSYFTIGVLMCKLYFNFVVNLVALHAVGQLNYSRNMFRIL